MRFKLTRSSGHPNDGELIEVETAEDILAIAKREATGVIVGPGYDGDLPVIEIYDTWRE